MVTVKGKIKVFVYKWNIEGEGSWDLKREGETEVSGEVDAVNVGLKAMFAKDSVKINTIIDEVFPP